MRAHCFVAAQMCADHDLVIEPTMTPVPKVSGFICFRPDQKTNTKGVRRALWSLVAVGQVLSHGPPNQSQGVLRGVLLASCENLQKKKGHRNSDTNTNPDSCTYGRHRQGVRACYLLLASVWRTVWVNVMELSEVA